MDEYTRRSIISYGERYLKHIAEAERYRKHVLRRGGWIDRDGNVLLLEELTDDHLRRIIIMYKNRAIKKAQRQRIAVKWEDIIIQEPGYSRVKEEARARNLPGSGKLP